MSSRLCGALVAALSVVVLLAGCDRPSRMPAASPTGFPVVACSVDPAVVPPNFHQVGEPQTEDAGSYRSIRVFYAGPRGRGLVLTAGSMMDFFEEAPIEEVTMVEGPKGSVFKDGKDRWVLLWYRNDACHQYTVGGSGLPLSGFLDLLKAGGLLAA